MKQTTYEIQLYADGTRDPWRHFEAASAEAAAVRAVRAWRGDARLVETRTAIVRSIMHPEQHVETVYTFRGPRHTDVATVAIVGDFAAAEGGAT